MKQRGGSKGNERVEGGEGEKDEGEKEGQGQKGGG